ncbi:MAG TPA: Na/Pi symporter [Thermaerobacter sp.]
MVGARAFLGVTAVAGVPLFPVAANLAGLAAGLALTTWGLRRAAGNRLHQTVERLQDAGPYHGLVAGLVLTALLQSSSTFGLLLLAAASAGWVRRPAARAALVGANLGTTLTAHLTATPSLGLAAVLATGGLALAAIAWHRPHLRAAGLAALGFAAALTALDGLSGALGPLAAGPAGAHPWADWVRRPWAGFAAGLVLSAAALSSSAVLALLQRAVAAGFLRPGEALPVVYGANVGTTSDVLLAGLLLRGPAWELALFHLGMNAATAVVAAPLGPVLMAAAGALTADPARQVAWAHTLFNALGAVLVWPWVVERPPGAAAPPSVVDGAGAHRFRCITRPWPPRSS